MTAEGGAPIATGGGGPPARIRALVVDDEPLARRGIVARLRRADGVEVVGECASGREAIDAIRKHRPDLVFLDVQMPGIDGFGVVDAIGVDAMPEIVFVTAYDAHALRAFDAHALDYLLKPIDDERFARMLERARRRVAERRASEVGRRVAALLAEMGGAEGGASGGVRAGAVDAAAAPVAREGGRLLVRDRGRVLLLDVSEIDWVEAEGDYVRLHVAGRSHLMRETMSAMERALDPARFVRIHRSTIVNIARIRELRPYTSREYLVLLEDGTRLKMSRSARERVRSVLGEGL